MKVAIATDSFKGTLSASLVCDIVGEALQRRYGAEVIKLPLADGGEGSMDCLYAAIGGTYIPCKIHNAFMEETDARVLMTPNGTAVVEMAEAVGLGAVEDRKDPMLTTTYGVGELIKCALGNGAKKILLALGGSSTNDGGMGMAVALGAKARDAFGRVFIPCGGTLINIEALDISHLDTRIAKTEFVAMCDVTNPLYGENGAAYVFAPQKGATDETLPLLDEGLRHYSEMLVKFLHRDFSYLEGGGAGGGIGVGVSAFCNATLKSGIECVLDTICFDARISDCDYVITGEGKLDEQSFMGKAVGGVLKHTASKKIKTIALVGKNTLGKQFTIDKGLSAVYELNPNNVPFEQIKKSALADLKRAAELIAL